MLTTIIICALTCVGIILAILLKPIISVKRLKLETYYLVSLAGAALMLLCSQISLKTVATELTADTAVNPLKILVLFISMTVLSVYLDEVGFFGYLASKVLKKSGESQIKLFIYLYVTVSVLTVFTSNDIIILTFTPFICYFSKNASIEPLPFLIAEFIAANTWSMALIIGNPTNIYLATSTGIDFVGYFKTMLLPTVFAGITAFAVLWLIFRKKLSKPIMVSNSTSIITNKFGLIVGLILLSVCTLTMAVGSYFGVEMWVVSFSSALLLFAITSVYSLTKHQRPKELIGCLVRAPWQLIPFVLSMFVVVLAMRENGVTDYLASLTGNSNVTLKYGLASFLAANIINNIPMSVLFSPIITSLPEAQQMNAAYGAVIGSNIGAFLTPIGALAGIMWTGMLKKFDVKLGFIDFVKYGSVISVPTIFAAIVGIEIVM